MALQDLAYEISYNTNESGLMKSVELINSLDASLDGMVKKVDSIANAFSKFNTPINNLGKSTSDLNVDNLSNSLKNATSNATELNASTERQQRLTEMVNKYVDEYNSKIDESSKLAEQLNNRTANLSAPVEKMVAEQQRLNQEIFEGVENENKFASVLNKVQEGMSKGAAKANEFSSSLSGLRSISTGMSGILGTFGFIGVGYGLAAGVREAISSYAEFEQEMARVKATLQTVSNLDMTKLANQAMVLSNKYAISVKEIAEGEESLASHGLDAKQIMDSLEASVLLATDGNIKMKDATLDISSAVRNFGLEMSSSMHIANMYAKAAADTAADMPNMATAMSYISPVASEAGWSIESVVAAIGLLGDKGILGSKAGMGLRQMFERLINPTDEAAKKMEELGFEAIDPTTHKMKGISTLIGDLQKSFEGLNDAQRGNALAVMFGAQALTPMSALLKTNKKAIDDETNSLKNSDKAARNMAITVNDTLSKAFDKFKINIQNAFIVNIEESELGKSLKNFIAGINNDLPSITNNIAWMLNSLVSFGSTVKKNWDGIAAIVLGVASAFLTLKGAMAIGAAIKTLGGLKKALPTIEMAAGIGLISSGFWEIKKGNTGLGDLLVGTGAGFVALGVGLKATTSAGIGLVAAGFLEIKQGNTGLGDLLIATGAGFMAVSVGTSKLTGAGIGLVAAGFLEIQQGNTGLGELLIGTGAGLIAVNEGLIKGAIIGLVASGFVQLKEGNTGLASLLFGTAAGLAAFNVALAITSALALPVTWPIYAIAGAIGAVTAAVIYVKTHWAESWIAMKTTAMEIINPIINIIDDLAAAMNKIFGTNFNTNHTITYSESDKKMLKDLGYSDKVLSEMTGARSKETSKTTLENFKVTSGTQAATNIATDKSQINILDLLPKNANGTNHFQGGLSLVGERGPEVVNIPKGSQVIPANKTSKMLSGSFAQMGTGTLGASAELNNSTEKVIADNQKIITGYVDQHKLYGRDSVENFSVALLQNESLSTNATSTLSTDNKNIMNNLSLSGYTYGSGVVNNLAQGVQASEGNLTTVVQTLTDKVIETFKSGFGIHSPSTVMYSMGTNLLQGLVNGMTSKDMGSFVQSWIGSMTSAAGGAMGGNVTGWLTAALGITGTPMSWISGLLRLVQAESGGNPIAWNPISVNGEHATGLLQTLPSTFASYAVKGLGDIFNPIANAAAAINYIKKTYGSVYNTPLFTSAGAYVGYEEGTRSATPGVHLVGEKGPELVWMKGGETVTPNDKISVASQTPYATSNNVSTQLSPSVVIHIHESKNPRDTADEVLRVLKKHFGPLFDDKMADLKIQMGLS